ncbi:cation:proton antiporter [Nocardia sp. NPDC048505]|uniref:cation:proton antiporter n=1 Tax=Nocardia sp. NPDC048505 TaxID=3155756 RepID=UPI0033F328AC
MLFVLQLTACVAICLALAWLGRRAASIARQPQVIGEISGGLIAGPALLHALGPDFFDKLLPADVLDALTVIGQMGLVLFLAGLIHEYRDTPSIRKIGLVLWVTGASLVLPLAAGVLMAMWLLAVDDPVLVGSAPRPAFILFCGVALSITAVPVLARILSDRELTNSPAGRVALIAAIAIDAVSWVLLTIVAGLSAGSALGLVLVLVKFGAAAVCVVALRRTLGRSSVRAMAVRHPRWFSAAIVGGAIFAGLIAQRLGLSIIMGAVLFGLTIPAAQGSIWNSVVAPAVRLGRLVVPVFFVATGITLFDKAFGVVSWSLIGVCIVVAIIAKIGGGYLGARLAGEDGWTSARVGVLLNTRGLTELIVLQAGYGLGVITAAMYFAFVVMALATTALTGPLLSLIHWMQARRPARVSAAASGPGLR